MMQCIAAYIASIGETERQRHAKKDRDKDTLRKTETKTLLERPIDIRMDRGFNNVSEY